MFTIPICINITTPPPDLTIKVVTYNIKHGVGLDNKLNLDRTAKTIKSFQADIIALQEVDKTTTRNQKVNQPEYLGKKLRLNPSFGAFMNFQGGQYGMALLSKYPVTQTNPYRLPDGNEPRIALITTLELPNKRPLLVINVHFDWVKVDKFRFSQASTLANHLKTIKTPYILLGDFNDEPGSRTIKLFQSIANEVKKAPNNRNTFPANAPKKEIDFIFTSPHFTHSNAKVLNEPLTSDHAPVSATVTLKG